MTKYIIKVSCFATVTEETESGGDGGFQIAAVEAEQEEEEEDYYQEEEPEGNPNRQCINRCPLNYEPICGSGEPGKTEYTLDQLSKYSMLPTVCE